MTSPCTDFSSFGKQQRQNGQTCGPGTVEDGIYCFAWGLFVGSLDAWGQFVGSLDAVHLPAKFVDIANSTTVGHSAAAHMKGRQLRAL